MAYIVTGYIVMAFDDLQWLLDCPLSWVIITVVINSRYNSPHFFSVHACLHARLHTRPCPRVYITRVYTRGRLASGLTRSSCSSSPTAKALHMLADAALNRLWLRKSKFQPQIWGGGNLYAGRPRRGPNSAESHRRVMGSLDRLRDLPRKWLWHIVTACVFMARGSNSGSAAKMVMAYSYGLCIYGPWFGFGICRENGYGI